MSKIFIRTDVEGYVNYRNNFPFHEKWGLNKTESELLQDGFLVNSVPEAPIQEGKITKTKYVNGQFEFVYEDVPVSPEQKLIQLEQENANLFLDNAIQETRINDLETENANILLELAMIKGGVA